VDVTHSVTDLTTHVEHVTLNPVVWFYDLKHLKYTGTSKGL